MTTTTPTVTKLRAILLVLEPHALLLEDAFHSEAEGTRSAAHASTPSNAPSESTGPVPPSGRGVSASPGKRASEAERPQRKGPSRSSLQIALAGYGCCY